MIGLALRRKSTKPGRNSSLKREDTWKGFHQLVLHYWNTSREPLSKLAMFGANQRYLPPTSHRLVNGAGRGAPLARGKLVGLLFLKQLRPAENFCVVAAKRRRDAGDSASAEGHLYNVQISASA